MQTGKRSGGDGERKKFVENILASISFGGYDIPARRHRGTASRLRRTVEKQAQNYLPESTYRVKTKFSLGANL